MEMRKLCKHVYTLHTYFFLRGCVNLALVAIRKKSSRNLLMLFSCLFTYFHPTVGCCTLLSEFLCMARVGRMKGRGDLTGKAKTVAAAAAAAATRMSGCRTVAAAASANGRPRPTTARGKDGLKSERLRRRFVVVVRTANERARGRCLRS